MRASPSRNRNPAQTLPARALAALCGLLVVTWGLCPCALSRAVGAVLAGSVSAGSVSTVAETTETPSCCCGKHRSGCDRSTPDRDPAPTAPSPGGNDCPKCIVSGCHGSLAAPDAQPPLADAASVVVAALPVAVLVPETVRLAPAARPDGTGAPPPDVGVETIVLLL